MRDLRIHAVAFGTAVLILTAGGTIAVQEATPLPATEGGVLPPGVTAERLAAGPAEHLLPSPAVVELVRFTFAPGAGVVLPEASPSLALVYVESGVLRVRITAPVTLTRAANGSREEPEPIPAGTAFMADQGDFFVAPPHVAAEARNDGAEPLVLLMAVLEPASALATPVTAAP
jgi:quercetin dioxygenase-like cupin family protein